MEADFTVYLANMNDEQLGLFWIVASPRAKAWIQGELVRRAAARGEAPVSATAAQRTNDERKVVAAA
jgi:hypothetical protein